MMTEAYTDPDIGKAPEQLLAERTKRLQDAMQLMTENHIRHLPVCEGNSPVGVISIGDVVGAIIGDKEFLIEQLENYIAGGR